MLTFWCKVVEYYHVIAIVGSIPRHVLHVVFVAVTRYSMKDDQHLRMLGRNFISYFWEYIQHDLALGFIFEVNSFIALRDLFITAARKELTTEHTSESMQVVKVGGSVFGNHFFETIAQAEFYCRIEL